MIRTEAPFARSLPQEKMAPEKKNTAKRRVPITEVVVKKETRAEKKKDKRPAALTLQFCRK